jgi:hypothetical protein
VTHSSWHFAKEGNTLLSYVGYLPSAVTHLPGTGDAITDVEENTGAGSEAVDVKGVEVKGVEAVVEIEGVEEVEEVEEVEGVKGVEEVEEVEGVKGVEEVEEVEGVKGVVEAAGATAVGTCFLTLT